MEMCTYTLILTLVGIIGGNVYLHINTNTYRDNWWKCVLTLVGIIGGNMYLHINTNTCRDNWWKCVQTL